MKFLNLISMMLLFVVVSCSTASKFKVPTGSKLFIEGQEVSSTFAAGEAAGAQVMEYKRNPFFWDVAKGIPYRIEKDGKVIDEGKIKSQFRAVSIFWPPAAIIYWPLGFNKDGYDFTSKGDSKVRPESNYVNAGHRK